MSRALNVRRDESLLDRHAVPVQGGTDALANALADAVTDDALANALTDVFADDAIANDAHADNALAHAIAHAFANAAAICAHTAAHACCESGRRRGREQRDR